MDKLELLRTYAGIFNHATMGPGLLDQLKTQFLDQAIPANVKNNILSVNFNFNDRLDGPAIRQINEFLRSLGEGAYTMTRNKVTVRLDAPNLEKNLIDATRKHAAEIMKRAAAYVGDLGAAVSPEEKTALLAGVAQDMGANVTISAPKGKHQELLDQQTVGSGAGRGRP